MGYQKYNRTVSAFVLLSEVSISGLTSGSECSNEEIIKCDKKCGSQKGLAGESAETMFQLHMTKKGLEVELIPNPKISCEWVSLLHTSRIIVKKCLVTLNSQVA